MNKIKVILSLLFASAFSSAETNRFEQLLRSFSEARQPKSAQVRGYWSGRCTHWHQPEEIWPSFYIFKTVQSYSGTSYDSQTYYVDYGQDASRFDEYTPSQIESEPALSPWHQQVEWSPLRFTQGSLINFFSWPGFPPLARETRYLPEEENGHILLRVVSADSQHKIYSLCSYTKFLGSLEYIPIPSPIPTPTPVPTPTPTPIPTPTPSPHPTPSPLPANRFLFGNIGPDLNTEILLENKTPSEKINRLVFINLGPNLVRISRVHLQLEHASLALGEVLRVEPNQETEIPLGILGKVKSIHLFVTGPPTKLQLFGLRTY